MVSSAFMWTMWKFRNDLHFGRVKWSGLQVIWHRLFRLLRRWSILSPKKKVAAMEAFLNLPENKISEAPQILPAEEKENTLGRSGDASSIVRSSIDRLNYWSACYLLCFLLSVVWSTFFVFCWADFTRRFL
ncbi:hypothetical protein BRADI_4g20992v3 [Brachypodium distachyon]|uniref:Uncharacterized protein n=1 Tax=Brachypodium distachyon TaxID=15368 RepID=A0A2K2CP14_BRADI|nr:hypothetical protein BRADI_4g20992v3 [Brachypodium distachyon]